MKKKSIRKPVRVSFLIGEKELAIFDLVAKKEERERSPYIRKLMMDEVERKGYR